MNIPGTILAKGVIMWINKYIELPDPLPATHFAENALRNVASQLQQDIEHRRGTTTMVELQQYWEAVVHACHERDRNLPLEEKIARGLPI